MQEMMTVEFKEAIENCSSTDIYTYGWCTSRFFENGQNNASERQINKKHDIDDALQKIRDTDEFCKSLLFQATTLYT